MRQLVHADQLVVTIGIWIYSLVVSVTPPALAKWSDLAAKGRYARLRRDFRMRQFGTASLAVLAAVVALLMAPQLLVAVSGPAYRAGASLMRVHTIMWIAGALGCWYHFCFMALGSPGRVMLPNVAWGLILVAVTYVLTVVLRAGAIGAVVANLKFQPLSHALPLLISLPFSNLRFC